MSGTRQSGSSSEIRHVVISPDVPTAFSDINSQTFAGRTFCEPNSLAHRVQRPYQATSPFLASPAALTPATGGAYGRQLPSPGSSGHTFLVFDDSEEGAA
jgi:hypothetical protein